jgi:hypothetical protein
VRHTSAFKIQVYKDWTLAAGPTNLIMESNAPIAESFYNTNSISNFNLQATNKIVQEPTTHSFTFQTASIVPGTDLVSGAKTDMLPAFHIYFPQQLIQDPANNA